MMLGMWLFRERIDRWGWAAIGLAAVGVLFQALALGRPPWISIALALSFGTYGVIKKRIAVDAQAGLFIECLLLLPFGVVFVAWLQMQGLGHGFASLEGFGWALLNGPATVLPLALFGWAARRMPLSTMGFIQFLAPTLQFCVGVGDGRGLHAAERRVVRLHLAGRRGIRGGGPVPGGAARRAVAVAEPV